MIRAMRRRILIADDDDDIRFTLRKALEEEFDVVVAADGLSAVEAVRALQPDLVISDLHMPGCGGLEITQAANEISRLLPVIIVTGSGTLQTALEALRGGAYDYILKPFEDLGVIRHAVRRALEVRTYREENQRLFDDLRRKNELIVRELRMAQSLQRAVLPAPPAVEGLGIFARLEPARQVGGDFYDFLQFRGKAHRLGFIQGDVVGKGVPAALLMMLTLSLVRDLRRTVPSPAELLRRLNHRLREQVSEAERLEVTASVSAMAVDFDMRTRRMRYAKAGHEDLLRWRAADREVETLVGSGIFLGVFDQPRYEQCGVALDAGDRVFVYTDGIPDARNSAGVLYGLERFREAIAATAHLPLSEQGEAILGGVESFRGGQEPSDDTALVIFEIG